MIDRPELYFKNTHEWRTWLLNNHDSSNGIYIILYKVNAEEESMRWEEAVQIALCFGWIDSTVKRIDEKRRKQLFTPRKPKSVWSALNKKHIEYLISEDLMHESGLAKINAAKKDKSWFALDDVENLVIPKDLANAFDKNPTAYNNYQNFSKSYKKSYLYWLFSAKRETTRIKRLTEIIQLCERNIKSRDQL